MRRPHYGDAPSRQQRGRDNGATGAVEITEMGKLRKNEICATLFRNDSSAANLKLRALFPFWRNWRPIPFS